MVVGDGLCYDNGVLFEKGGEAFHGIHVSGKGAHCKQVIIRVLLKAFKMFTIGSAFIS